MSRQVLHGAAVLGAELVPDAIVAVQDGVVVWSGPARDCPLAGWPVPQRLPDEQTILPGLVDLHCHGAVGFDFAAAGSSADPHAEGAARAAAYHRANGTTSLVASIVSSSDADTRRCISALAPLVDDGVLAGLHLEGPYLSPARRGAHDPARLRVPDLAELSGWLDLADGRIVQITLAPELPGAAAAAELAREAGAVAAVGHTDADQQTVTDALSAAAATGRPALVTHLFNAMPPLHHRAPGPVVAAIAAAARGDAVLELIADGVHVDDALAATVIGLVGPTHVALVTDAIAAAGTGDGDYLLGGLAVRVTGGTARLLGAEAGDTGPDTAPGPLAGGTSSLLDIVRRVAGGGRSTSSALSLAEVVTCASGTPATVLAGQDRPQTAPADQPAGSPAPGPLRPLRPLRPGARADLVVVDADLRPVRVAVGGRWEETSATPGCAPSPRG
jgi:N-acetylglucosamine-6-phosphate deacetylase